MDPSAGGLLSPPELETWHASDRTHALLDLRERGAFERGHIFRATSLPRRWLEARLPALVTAPETPLLLCDEDGELVELARPTLAAMGYRRVHALAGGLGAWQASGRPLVQGLNVPSKVFGEQVFHRHAIPQISAADLGARLACGERPLLLDTRTPEEYERGTIPGSINVPGGELVLRIRDLAPAPDTPIVVHCGGRTRSYIGAASLSRLGVPNPLLALENGTMGWLLAGLELEVGARRAAPEASPAARAGAAAVARRVAAEDGLQLLSPSALRELLTRQAEENVVVLDVRTREEYEAGHLVGALWVPGGQAIQATDEYVAVRDAWLVPVCDGSGRSTMTAAWLGRMGFPRVRVLDGGLPAWQAGGGQLETGVPRRPPFGYEAQARRVRRLAAGELARVIDAALVLDVESSDAYIRGHVPGAAWLCRSRLEPRIRALAPARERTLVLTCADGVQATLAAGALLDLGYAAARVLDGGTQAWAAAGRALERGATRLLDQPDDVVRKPWERGRAAMAAYLAWEEALDGEGRSPHALVLDSEGSPP